MSSSHLTSQDTEILELIEKIVHDPLLLRKLCDRVQDLIRQERWQKGDRDPDHARFKE